MKQLPEKININLFEGLDKNTYLHAKSKFISELLEYVNKDKAESKWNELYPSGFESWKNNNIKLNSSGEQNLIDKINEIIDYLHEIYEKEQGEECEHKYTEVRSNGELYCRNEKCQKKLWSPSPTNETECRHNSEIAKGVCMLCSKM